MRPTFRLQVFAIASVTLVWIVSFVLMWLHVWFWWAAGVFAACTIASIVINRTNRLDPEIPADQKQAW